MELNIDSSNWKKVKLGDVAFEYSCRINNPSESEFDRFVGSSNIGQWDFRVKSWEPTDSVTSTMKLFEPNDYLLVRRSLYASDFRERAPRAHFSGVCSGDILTIKENPEKVVDGFLIGIFNSPALWKYVVANASGSITRRIKWKELANYEFLLPPKDQQAQLTKLLWAVDRVIEKEVEVLRNVKQTHLVKIEKELINRESQKTYFEDLGEIIRGVGYKPNDLLDSYSVDTCIILRSNNIFESKINYDDIKILNLDGVKPAQILVNGDFAVCMSNGSKELVGKSALYTDEGKNVSIGSFCAGFRPKDDFSKRLLQHLFSSESYRYAIKRILSGSAINNLKPSDIESLFLRINENESKLYKLLDELDSLVNNIDVLESKISSSKALQKNLINQVF